MEWILRRGLAARGSGTGSGTSSVPRAGRAAPSATANGNVTCSSAHWTKKRSRRTKLDRARVAFRFLVSASGSRNLGAAKKSRRLPFFETSDSNFHFLPRSDPESEPRPRLPFPLKRTALAAREASGTSLPQKAVTDSEAGAFMRS